MILAGFRRHPGTMKLLDLAAFKQKLRTLEATSVALLGKREGIAVETFPDSSDDAQYQSDREMNARSLHYETTRLAAIRIALERITDGTYGMCERCDNVIGDKRLSAIPWASLCVRCQETIDFEQASEGADVPALVA